MLNYQRVPPFMETDIAVERSTMLLVGKSTISTGPCSIANCEITRGYHHLWKPPFGSGGILNLKDGVPLDFPETLIARC